MLSLFTQSIFNSSFGIFFPKFTGTIYELLSAPVSPFETVIGYVGAAATKSIILGLIILLTAGLFVPLRIAHPFWMIGFLLLTAPGAATSGEPLTIRETSACSLRPAKLLSPATRDGAVAAMLARCSVPSARGCSSWTMIRPCPKWSAGT